MSSPILFILLLTQQWKGCSSEKSGSLAMVRVTYRSTIKCLDQDWARVSPKNGITLVCKKCWMHEERYWGWGAGGRILKMVNCFFSTCQVHNNSYSLFFSLNPAESLFFFFQCYITTCSHSASHVSMPACSVTRTLFGHLYLCRASVYWCKYFHLCMVVPSSLFIPLILGKYYWVCLIIYCSIEFTCYCDRQ